ncbi:hypothetical protein Efla_003401 [Eimeria flavescens]
MGGVQDFTRGSAEDLARPPSSNSLPADRLPSASSSADRSGGASGVSAAVSSQVYGGFNAGGCEAGCLPAASLPPLGSSSPAPDHATLTAAEAALRPPLHAEAAAGEAACKQQAGEQPLQPRSNSSEPAGPVKKQQQSRMHADQVEAPLKNDAAAADASQRLLAFKLEARRSERVFSSSLLAAERQFTSRMVQTSAPAPPPVAASCTRHPSLRSFSHLASYDRFVVPEDSFTDKCGRGKLIGTRPPRPGSTSSGKYERLPPHIRSLLDFRQEVIHPAVLRVGLQMGQRKIVGSNARTAAMLTAFQRFIEDYSPPPYQAIDKHLKQMLDRQINFITHCRPHSIAMGGTIRWLKRRLSSYAALQLEETRSRLSLDISNFIAGRLLSATWTAASIVEQQLIENGDNVMVFGRSTAINCALLQSRKQGLQFSVVMVDAPHSVSGQATAKEFADAGIYVTYTMLNGLSYHIRGITKVLLGCAALLANGYVVNSAGAAIVAMMGKMHAKPVLVVTETYKMSDRVMLDSCSFNELADPALVWRPTPEEMGVPAAAAAPAAGCMYTATGSSEGGEGGSSTAEAGGGGQQGAWGQQQQQQEQQQQQQHPRCPFCHSEFQVPVANPTYDVTPAQFIDYVVTEDGVFPASSIPALICGLGKSPAVAD